MYFLNKKIRYSRAFPVFGKLFFPAIALLAGGVALLAPLRAQETPAPAPVAMRPLQDAQWQKAAEGLDYSKDQPKPPKPVRQRPLDNAGRDWTLNTDAWGKALQILAIILAVALIGYGIYRMLQEPRNRAVARDGVEITLENLEQYLQETDLERFLREALAQGNFAQAIRLYYLQAIKDLSGKNAIHWSREKTNRDYLREMRTHPLSQAFRIATLEFERVWYGNARMDAAEFARLEPDFKKLISSI